MKKTYKNTDERTGFTEGQIIELTDEELLNTPFNVYLQHVEQDELAKTKKVKK